MSNDDDTDVIFEGSPLYQHLKNVGLEDFEVAEKFLAEEISSTVTLSETSKESILTRWKKKINVGAVINAFLKDANTAHQVLGKEISQLILGSSLLLPSDRLLLHDFSSPSQNRPGSFIAKYISLVVVLASYCITKFGTNAEVSTTFELVLLILLSGTTLFFSVQIVFSFVCWRLTSRVHKSIKNAVEVFAELKVQLKKGIRDIQETELIARGFTLASITNPISRLESSHLPIKTSEKQFPEYRSFLFASMKICFLQYREMTLDMMNSCPLPSEMDVPSYYVACVTLKELGPVFEKETSDRLLVEITNDYSVSSLKLIFQIMELQLSELLRRICFCFLDFSAVRKDLHAVNFLTSRLGQLTATTRALVSKLSRFQLFHSRIHLEEFPSPASKPESQNDFQKFQMTMHSVSLHLKAVILRIQRLEEQKDGYYPEKLDELLAEVRAEIDASYVCLEESASHLLSMKGEKPQVCKLPPLLIPVSPTDDQIRGPPIPIFDMDEPIVEDQVFEATTTVKNESGQSDSGMDEEIWIEEKARRKAEKEASRHLFKELKSILVVKAEEHRVREERALLGKHRIGNEEASSEVPSPKTSSRLEDCAEETVQTVSDLQRAITPPFKTPSASTNQSENDETDCRTNVHIIPEKTASVPAFHAERIESHFGGVFSLAASVAEQAAQRSQMLGFKVETIGDDTFGDSSDTD